MSSGSKSINHLLRIHALKQISLRSSTALLQHRNLGLGRTTYRGIPRRRSLSKHVKIAPTWAEPVPANKEGCAGAPIIWSATERGLSLNESASS
jgi:hypothetical protein